MTHQNDGLHMETIYGCLTTKRTNSWHFFVVETLMFLLNLNLTKLSNYVEVQFQFIILHFRKQNGSHNNHIIKVWVICNVMGKTCPNMLCL
jgi:hypothetical protein